VTGPLLAAAAGFGFGVFQTLNRRAVGTMSDAYLATFLQLVVAMAVLLAASVTTADLAALGGATTASLMWFGAAGLVHFFVGWTLLNMSQIRIGAARTSPLLSTNPVFGAALATAWLREVPRLLAWLGILLVVAGALTVSLERVGDAGWAVSWRDAAPGLLTALAWSITPIFIREGLDGLESPLLGLTLGMGVALVCYAAVAPFRPRPEGQSGFGSRQALAFKLLAGVMVGLSVWARWVSLESTAVAVVLALGLLSVPVVLLLSPILVGRHLERVTLRLWSGATLVVLGGVLLVLAG
jgi:drug/metabolite transporter (DMT)-like permease